MMRGGGAGGATGGVSGGTGEAFDFNYPVEVADGQRLTISWNRGDDANAVALAFARQHGGIGADELPAIAGFITQVGGNQAAAPMQMQAAPPVPSAEMQQRALMQVMEIGFDEATARAALQAMNWNTEA